MHRTRFQCHIHHTSPRFLSTRFQRIDFCMRTTCFSVKAFSDYLSVFDNNTSYSWIGMRSKYRRLSELQCSSDVAMNRVGNVRHHDSLCLEGIAACLQRIRYGKRRGCFGFQSRTVVNSILGRFIHHSHVFSRNAQSQNHWTGNEYRRISTNYDTDQQCH